MLSCSGPGVEWFPIVVLCLGALLRGQNGYYCILHHQKAHSELMLPPSFLWTHAVGVISERMETAYVMWKKYGISLWRADIMTMHCWVELALKSSDSSLQEKKAPYENRSYFMPLLKLFHMSCCEKHTTPTRRGPTQIFNNMKKEMWLKA